jgi:hypothetical protein
MSTWLGFSPDSAVLFATVIGAGLGASVTYLVVKRQWWKVSGSFAFDVAIVLNMVTEGKSGSVHKAVLATWLVSSVYYIIVLFVVDRRAKRASVRTVPSPRTDRVSK